MYIGVDLGGTNIAIGLLDDAGSIISKVSKPTMPERGADAVIEDMIAGIKEVIEKEKIDLVRIKSIGVGIPGVADHEGRAECVNLYWQKVPLRAPLQAAFNLPVLIENDATVAGFAEFEMGTMKGAKSGIFITLGTGVGGGIIVDHKVVSGAHGVGSEIGHMMVGDNFYTCNCGQNGCLETYASSTAIIKYVKKELKENQIHSEILSRVGGDVSKIDAKVIFDAAKDGDPLGQVAVKRFVKYLAKGITNLVNILDPEIIALGGGVSHAGEFLRSQVEAEVKANKLFENLPVAEIKLAQLKNDAGIIGAGLLGRQL